MTKLENAKLKSILPSSISHDEKMRAAADSLQKWLTSIAKAGPDGQLWVDIDALSSLELDHLAWQFRADVWRDTWPIEIKRSTIRNVIEDKRLKGTRWAVERAVEHLGSSVEVVEWWETDPKGPHNTFEVIISVNEIPGQAGSETQRDLYAAIDAAKPAREVYRITISASALGEVGIYGAIRPFVYRKMHAVGEEGETVVPVKILSPVAGEAVTRRPTVSGVGPVGAQITISDNFPRGTVTVGGDGTWSFVMPYNLELYYAIITATDGATTDSVVVHPYPPPSPLVITSPQDGETVTTANPTVTGTAESYSNVSVNGDLVYAGNGAWGWVPWDPLPPGANTITASYHNPVYGEQTVSIVVFVDV